MNHRDTPAPHNFDELADWLLTVDSQFSPAELHGAIVGALCGAMRLPAARWAQFGFAVMGASETINRQFSELAETVLGGLAREQFELLSSEDMTFQPFLPDDDETIEQRTDSLSDWCRGFLGGFAEAQVYLQKNAPQTESAEPSLAASLPEAVQESLTDLAAIAQATVEGDEAYDEDYDAELSDDPLALDSILTEDGEQLEFEPADAEAAERDYMEIIEYLRLAAMTVFSEYGWVEIIEQQQQKQPILAADQPAPPGATQFFKSGNKTMH
jgi:uncharacterized protein YgfB (UPF0149 family)